MLFKRISSCLQKNCDYSLIIYSFIFILFKNDEEFQKAIKTVLFERKKICYEWKYQSFREIPNDLVEGYFRPLDEDLKIPEYKPNIRPHALYPVKVNVLSIYM